MERMKLIKIYDPAIQPGLNVAERKLFKDKFTPEQKENLAKLVGNFRFDSSIVGKKVALHRNRAEMQSNYSLSPYGVSFIRAVSSGEKARD